MKDLKFKNGNIMATLTRAEIIEMWSKQSAYQLNSYCCPNCRDILLKNNNTYYCSNCGYGEE